MFTLCIYRVLVHNTKVRQLLVNMNISYVVDIIPIEMSWHHFISTKESFKNLTEILQKFYGNLVSQPMCHTDLTIYKNPNKL